jgi:hypothetical protein
MANPGRIAGLWYLLLVLLGPLRLIYIPAKLFDFKNVPATVDNIAAHEWLFRIGMVSDLAIAIILIFLTLALFRLFRAIDAKLAILVVLFGGVLPSLIYFINVTTDAGALTIVNGADFLSVFSRAQQEALVVLLLKLHNHQITAAETLWGIWLFPLALLTYRSRFMPRFLGIWLGINGLAYVILSVTGFLAAQYSATLFKIFQPALLGELAFMLWLVIKGAEPRATHASPSDERMVGDVGIEPTTS